MPSPIRLVTLEHLGVAHPNRVPELKQVNSKRKRPQILHSQHHLAPPLMSQTPWREVRQHQSITSPGGDRSESPTNRIPLGVKSLSRLNTQQSSELGWHPTLGNTVRKRGAQFDDENSDEPKSKRLYLGYVAREVLGCKEVRKEIWKEIRKEVRKEIRKEVRKEVRKREAQCDNEHCGLPKSKRVRSSFVRRLGVGKETRRRVYLRSRELAL